MGWSQNRGNLIPWTSKEKSCIEVNCGKETVEGPFQTVYRSECTERPIENMKKGEAVCNAAAIGQKRLLGKIG